MGFLTNPSPHAAGEKDHEIPHQPFKLTWVPNLKYLYRLDFVVSIFCAIILVIMLLPTLTETKSHSHHARCRNHLKQIGMGIANYADSFNDRYPPYNGASFLAALYVTGMVSDDRYFLCRPRGHEADGAGAKLARTFARRSQGGPGDADGTSYLGRQNHPTSPYTTYDPEDDPEERYRRNLHLRKNASRTTVAADDEACYQKSTSRGCHRNAVPMRIFLFLDGHVEAIQSDSKRSERNLAPLLPPGRDG